MLRIGIEDDNIPGMLPRRQRVGRARRPFKRCSGDVSNREPAIYVESLVASGIALFDVSRGHQPMGYVPKLVAQYGSRPSSRQARGGGHGKLSSAGRGRFRTVSRFMWFDLGIWCCVGVRVTLSEPPGSGVRAERFGSGFGRLLHAGGFGKLRFDRGDRIR